MTVRSGQQCLYASGCRWCMLKCLCVCVCVRVKVFFCVQMKWLYESTPNG